MAVLGAIIGGGKSRRFGSDKAAALLFGKPLIEHVYEGLKPQVDRMIICGRTWRDWDSIPDAPVPDLGPLGGLNAALSYGLLEGFEWVLTAPVDTLPFPEGLFRLFTSSPAYIAEQRLIGLWPTSLSALLKAHLETGQRSVRSWVEVSGATLIEAPDIQFMNMNRLEDFAAYNET